MPNYDLGTAEGKIVLDSSGVDNAVTAANASMGRLGKGGKSAAALGRDLTLGLTVPIVAAGGYALKTAIDFETAFTGVTKTVSASQEQIAQLRQELIDMSMEIPASTTEIASVMEAAGQLGVPVDAIAEFSKVMIELGVSTDLTSTAAADAIAHITNVMGTSVGDFERFGGALVGLGNDSAATESEILEMAARIAGIADLTGSSEAELLAISAALSSVGINAEAGGTSVTRTIKDFDKFSLAIQQADGKVEDLDSKSASFLNLINNNRGGFDEFVTLDGIRQYEFFVQALQNAQAEGGNLIGILDSVGIKQIRQSDAILRMVGAENLLTDTLANGDKQWELGNALQKESSKRFETTASQMQILHNKADNAARILGEALVPMLISMFDALGPVIEAITLLAEGFSALPKPVQQIIVGILAVLAVLGPILFIGSKVVLAFQALASIVGILTSGFGALGAVLLANPIVLLIVAIVALIAAFVILYKKNEKFRNAINNFAKEVRELWGKVVDFFKTLPEFFQKVWDAITGFFVDAKNTVVDAWNAVAGFFADLGQTIADAFNTAKDAVTNFVTGAAGAVADFFASLPGLIGGALSDAFGAFVDFLSKLPNETAYWLGFVVGRWLRLGYEIPKTIITTGINVIKAIGAWLAKLPGIVAKFLAQVLVHFINWGQSLLTTVINTGVQIVTFLINKFTEFATWLPGFLMGIFNQFVAWGGQLISWAASTFINFVTQIMNQIITLPGKILGKLSEIISALPGKAAEFASKGLEIGLSFFNGVWDQIKDFPSKIFGLISDAINGLSSLGQTAYNKLKSIGESMWNGFKKGLFGSPHTKVEYAVWDMRDNVDDAITRLASQMRIINTLSRNIPAVTSAEPVMGSQAHMAISAGLARSGGDGAISGAGVVQQFTGPLIGSASIRDDRDIVKLARELRNQAALEARAKGAVND